MFVDPRDLGVIYKMVTKLIYLRLVTSYNIQNGYKAYIFVGFKLIYCVNCNLTRLFNMTLYHNYYYNISIVTCLFNTTLYERFWLAYAMITEC